MAPLRSLGNIRSAFDDFYARTGKDAVTPFTPPPITATGGNTSAGLTPGNGYRYHVFTSPGNFVVASGVQDVEIFGVGAGGPGGSATSATQVGYTSGGGAGGIFYTTAFEVGPGTHAVTVGAQGTSPTASMRAAGADTTFVHGSTTLTAKGGGHGGYYGKSYTPSPTQPGPGNEWGRGGEGGSGGGNTYGATPFAPTVGPGIQPTQNPGIANLTNYGNPGGANSGGPIYGGGGGGGGAGAAGADGAMPNSSGAGGNGQPFPAFAAPLISPDIPSPDRSDWTSEVGPTGLYGGGGGGAGSTNPSYPQHPAQPGGTGGGGDGVDGSTGAGSPTAKNGTNYTGGGGGGGGNSSGQQPKGGFGGAGILVIRYQPGS